MKILWTILATLLCVTAFSQDFITTNDFLLEPVQVVNPYAEEIRGIWINSDNMPKTNEEAVKLVNEYYNAGFNLLFPEVICRGYTIYKSNLLERDPRFVDCDDTLTTIINEAHKLSMEVHPWVWCFRAGYTDHPGAILTLHPDWIECSKYGDTLSVNGGMWISPFIPEATDFLISLYKEIVSNYNVDGLHLDYVRYEAQNPIPFGFSTIAKRKYRMHTGGMDPAQVEYLSSDYIRWIEYREKQVTDFVSKTNKALKEIKPNIIVSAAVASNPVEARLNYMQNWPHWVANNWIDYIVPMTYMTDDAKFQKLMDTQLGYLKGKVWTTVGIGSHLFTKNESKNIDQIKLARNTDYMGQALFAAKYMTPSLESSLKTQVWDTPATLPFHSNSEKTQEILNYKNSINKYMPAESIQKYFPKNLIRIPSYTIHEKIEDITIDGNLYEWDYYEPITIQYDNMGKDTPYTTQVKMTYDDEAIYICYNCLETEMSLIKADNIERDGYTFYDDSVDTFIQMNPKVPKYDHFSVNTLNAHFDQQIFNVAWSSEWESRISKNLLGWCAEIKIPYESLSVEKPKKGDYWRMNFTRNRWVTGQGENLNWSVAYGSFHNIERLGYVWFE